MNHTYGELVEFVDLFRGMIKDTTHELRDAMDGHYHLLNEKIEELQHQNAQLSMHVQDIQGKLHEAQAEITEQKDEINQLNGKSDTLTLLNVQNNVKMDKMENYFTEQHEKFLTKINHADFTELQDQQTEIRSNFKQLKKEMKNLKFDQEKNLQRQVQYVFLIVIASSIAAYWLPSLQINKQLNKSVEIMQNKLEVIQAEVDKLSGENNMLALLNGQTNMRFGEIEIQIASMAKQHEQILTKIDHANFSPFQPGQSNLSFLESKVESHCNQLDKEIEGLKSEYKKTQAKTNIIDDLQANVNSLVSIVEGINIRLLAKPKEFKAEIQSTNKLNMEAIDNKVGQLEDDIKTIKFQLRIFAREKFAINEFDKYKAHSFTWKIDGIEEIVKHNTFSIESEVFPVIGYPYDAKAKFTIERDGYAFASLMYVNENQHGMAIPFKIYPQVTFTLKNLNGTDKDVVRSYEHPFNAPLKFGHFSYERWLRQKDLLHDATSSINDYIIIDIAIDPPFVTNIIVSNDGILTSTIDNYKIRKQRAVDGFEYFHSSPHFYTSPSGFRVKLNMYMNGHGDYTAKGITADILFLTGENDSNLTLPFAHKTTIVIFNPFDSTKHYIYSTNMTIENDRNYLIDVLTFEEIENEGFLKDDTLYFKIIIQPL